MTRKKPAPPAIDRTPDEAKRVKLDEVAPSEIQRADRRADCLRMRNRGMTYSAIGEALGISPETVSRDIQRGLKAILREPAEDMVATQRTILRDIRASMYPYMLAGDEKAADKILKTLDHEAKLFGLYAPERVSINGGNEDFASTAIQLMNELGIAPGPDIGGLHQDALPVGTTPVLDAETVDDAEIVDAWSNI